MFFKNIRIYQLTDKLNLNAVALNAAMADHKFTPCMSQDALKIGFTAALHPSFGELAFEVEPGLLAVALRRQEKMLPSAVIDEELQPKVAAAELEKGRPLSRKEKSALKEDLILSLLPRAFCRSTVVNALIDDANGLLFVDTTSASRAEELLALLRKSLGSLPAVPWLDSNLLSQSMQQWLAGQDLPAGMQLGHEAELKAPDEEGAKVRFSNHLLTTGDVQSHLEDKLVTQLDLQIPEQLSFRITDDGSIRRLTWHELIAGKNEELGWDDVALRLQADCLLMAGELHKVVTAVKAAVGGKSKGVDLRSITTKESAKNPIWNAEDEDPLYQDAVRFVVANQRVSVSAIQRKFQIGYNRSAWIVEVMERRGVVSAANSYGQRNVLLREVAA